MAAALPLRALVRIRIPIVCARAFMCVCVCVCVGYCRHVLYMYGPALDKRLARRARYRGPKLVNDWRAIERGVGGLDGRLLHSAGQRELGRGGVEAVLYSRAGGELFYTGYMLNLFDGLSRRGLSTWRISPGSPGGGGGSLKDSACRCNRCKWAVEPIISLRPGGVLEDHAEYASMVASQRVFKLYKLY